MTRVLGAGPIALTVFVAVLAFVALLLQRGLVPDDAVTLWAGAIAAGDGEMPIGRIAAAYPTIPFLSTALLQFLAPAGTPVPALVTAALAALVAGIWFLSFRDAGLSIAVAVAATLLLALHPALLQAAVGGPAEMFLVAFAWLLARALFGLRRRGGTPDMMAVALALTGLTFSHPMGAALAAAAVPYLVFAVRPALIANSPVNVVAALVFPAIFAVASFAYVSWVFPGSGWSFFGAPAASLSGWATGMAAVFGGSHAVSLALAAGFSIAVAGLVAAPVAAVSVARLRRNPELVAPVAVLSCAAVTAAVASVATGLFGNPSSVIVMAPILAAIAVAHGPGGRPRPAALMALLAVGRLGGAAGLAIVDPHGAAQLRFVLEGRGSDRERLDALGLGQATVGRNGVLVDSHNAPAIVLGRGGAAGLLAPFTEAFELSTMFSRIDRPFVAVPNPHSGAAAQDRLSRAFPLIYRDGVPGYRVVYQNTNWRLFARELRSGSSANR